MKRIILFFLFFVSTVNVNSQEINASNNSVKRYFYRDSIVSIEKWYGNDKKLDSLKTFYKTGELDEVFYYNKGRYHNSSYRFNRSGEKLVTWNFENGKLIERIDHKLDYNKKDEEKIKNLHIKLKVLNDKIRTNPKTLKLIHQRAYTRYKLGDRTLALHDFKLLEHFLKKTTKANKTNPPYQLMGNIYDAIGGIYASFEMETYASHYRYKAVKADPENNVYKYNLGSYLYSIKSYRLSLVYLNKVLEKWKGHAFSHRVLAALYTDFEDYEKGMYHINLAFPKEKNLIKFGNGKAERDLRTIRGFLHHKLGNSEQGIADLKEALNLNRDNSFALRNLGVVYFDHGNYDLACQNLKKAQDLGYEKIHDRYNLQEYLDAACQKADELEEVLSAISEPIKTTRLVDKPFVYPNPGKDIVRIKNLSFERFNYEIYDFTSKLVSRKTSINGSIIISNLSQGVYILKVISDNGLVESFRIIKE